MPKESKKKGPKRARSAFMCFSNANRDKIKAANPNIAFGDVGKKLGEAWKEASQEEKKKYEAEAADDKIRYQRELDKYRQEHPNSEEEDKGSKKKTKKKKDPNAPKRPTTAFFFFLNENRDQVKKDKPELKVTEVTKHLSERWAKMSDDQKKRFIELAAKDKDRYQKQMAAVETVAKPSRGSKKKEKAAPKEEASDEGSGSGEEDGSAASEEEGSDE